MKTMIMKGFEVQYWLLPSDIKQMEYSEYWNNEEFEKNKAWYVLDGDFAKMAKHLEDAGLAHQLQQCLTFLKNTLNQPLRGVGADLAAGNLWVIPYLIKEGKVEKIYAVEYSQHRLLKLGPKVLQHYKVPQDKVVFCLGSFYQLKLPNHSLDFVLLSSAFHHADRPHSLLAEIQRVLKPDGRCLIIGEHITLSNRKVMPGEVLWQMWIFQRERKLLKIRWFASAQRPESLPNLLML